MLETRNLTFVYGANTPFERTAISDINFSVQKGQCVGVIGHTGSGKSTLIQHLNGLLKPASGSVLLDGEDIWSGKRPIRQLRFEVGLVFQYPEYQLFEETIGADIAFGPKNMGLTGDAVTERVREALHFVGLSEKLMGKSPFDLSGGQKRRVAIAGVIAMRPKALILDEPTAGLDPTGRRDILEQIQAYRRASGAAVILVTHSMEDIARTVDELTVLSEGKIVMGGQLRDVFSKGEELKRIGLTVPTVTAVMKRIKGMGVELDDSVYTLDDAVRELVRAREAADHA